MTMSIRWCAAAVIAVAGLVAGPVFGQAEKKEINPVVIMETSEGTIKIELWPDKAPKTVENFLAYVDDKFYDGTIFHRVIDRFMIQGGGFTSDMKQKPTKAPVVNEARADVRNDRYTLAMARTNVVDSATAQFFINVVDNGFLNHKSKAPQDFGYCVFGKVVEGMDVVDKIKAVATQNSGPFQNVPVKAVVIKSVRRADAAK
jgi:cyclophilin family peptidyl-prolyl cis-trans isomerase